MSTKIQEVEAVKTSSDKFKLVLAVLMVVVAIAGYYLLQEHVARFAVFIGGLVVAVILAWWSSWGKSVIHFATSSWREMRRVTWPTRQVTVRMTAVVFAFSGIIALLLWIIDSIVGKIIFYFLHTGG